MKQMTSTGLAALCLAMLTGCGTSSGIDTAATGTTAKGPNASIVDPLTDGPTAAASFKAGNLLNAGQLSATRLTYDVATQKMATSNSTASIRKNVLGAYDVTVAGKTTSLTYQDKRTDSTSWEQTQRSPTNDIVYSLALWSAGKGGRDGLLTDENGQTFHKVLGYNVINNAGTGTRERGHFVVGNPTDPLVQMPLKTKTATYDGYFYVNILPSSGAVVENNMTASGGLTMVADFDKKTMSGQSTSFQVRDAGDYSPTTQNYDVVFKEGQITGNSFVGTVESTLSNMNGSYSGQFYGGNAQEAAGVINGAGGGSLTEGFFSVVAKPVK